MLRTLQNLDEEASDSRNGTEFLQFTSRVNRTIIDWVDHIKRLTDLIGSSEWEI